MEFLGALERAEPRLHPLHLDRGGDLHGSGREASEFEFLEFRKFGGTKFLLGSVQQCDECFFFPG